LRQIPDIEWVEVDFRSAWIESGRVRTHDIWLDELEHYVWYCEVDRRPGSYHQVLLQRLAESVQVHPDPWRWDRAVDKLTAHECLRAAGLPVPECIYVSPDNVEAALRALEAWGAVLLKPRRGAWGEGTMLIDHPATLRDLLGYARSLGVDGDLQGYFLEQYLENDPERWTSVTVLADRPVIGYRKRADKRVALPGGRTKVYDANQQGGSVDYVALDEEHRRLAIQASKALGCPFIGFDMIWTPKGPVIVDENTSPGNYAALYRMAGLEVAECFAAAIMQLIRPAPGASVGSSPHDPAVRAPFCD
jgi:glutathione synthase/RimK-type ligase-like ATP-grasp enzyme